MKCIRSRNRRVVSEFMDQFKFDSDKDLFIGIEREYFLADMSGIIQPRAKRVLSSLGDDEQFGYELSACQLESRVGPVKFEELSSALWEQEAYLRVAERDFGFQRIHSEVGPVDMPLDIYPDPMGRYQEITKKLPEEILSAACRVIGTHIHIGMPDHETALWVYNDVILYLDSLCALGDGSNGERLRLYKKMAPDCRSPYYNSWEDFYETAVEKGFNKDPRSCYHLIRISPHGTIEFRMFGVTGDIHKIVDWAEKCHSICAGER